MGKSTEGKGKSKLKYPKLDLGLQCHWRVANKNEVVRLEIKVR